MYFDEDSLATCAPIRKPKKRKFKTRTHRAAAIRALDHLLLIDGRWHWVKVQYDFHQLATLLLKIAMADESSLPKGWELQFTSKREVTKASLNELNYSLLRWSAALKDEDNEQRSELDAVSNRHQFLHQCLRSKSAQVVQSKIVLDLDQESELKKLLLKTRHNPPFQNSQLCRIARFVFWCGGEVAFERFATAMNRTPRHYIDYVKRLDRAINWTKSLQKRLETESKLSVSHDFDNNDLNDELHQWMDSMKLPYKGKGKIEMRLKKSINKYTNAKKLVLAKAERKLPAQIAALAICVKQGNQLLQSSIGPAFFESHAENSLEDSARFQIEISASPCFVELVKFFNERPPKCGQGENAVRRTMKHMANGNRLQDIRYVLETRLGIGTEVQLRPLRIALQRYGRVLGDNDRKGRSEIFDQVEDDFIVTSVDRVLRWLELFPNGVFTRGLCERTTGVLRQLRELADIKPFQKVIGQVLVRWSNRTDQIRDCFEDEKELPRELRSWLRRLTWFQRLAGEQVRLPSSLTKLLESPRRQQRELQHLAALEEKEGLNHKQYCRLKCLIEKPFDQQRFERQAIELTMELCVLSAVESLRTLLMGVVRQVWVDVAGEPLPSDWSDQRCTEYAQWAARMEPHEKKLLQQILSAHANFGANAKSTLPFNQVWIEKSKSRGYKIGDWLNAASEEVRIDDKALRIEVCYEPFETLLMGSIFNTCLAPDGCNEMSVLANAAHANKQVIYVRDRGGQIVARKLVAVNRDDQLVGYNCYVQSGFDDDGRKKLTAAVDSFCERLADRVGWTLSDSGMPQGLGHFWYDDGAVDWSRIQ